MPTLKLTEGARAYFPIAPRKQLLNHIVDDLAQTRPESVWAKVPSYESNYSGGYRKITYKMMANAINGLAWWIIDNLGASSTFETLAYFGRWDPRYIIVLLGAVKAGYKMVFPSPVYGTPGLVSLLDRLDCKIILASSKKLPVIPKLLEERQWQVHEIPGLSELLNHDFPYFPFDKTFETARSEPLVVVHTSGTTGAPKPLVWTHDWAASWIQQNQATPPEGFTSLEYLTHGIELCAVAPPNHSSSLFPNLLGAVPNQIVVLYPLLDSPLTLDTTIEMIRHNDPSLLIAPAHVLSGIASDSDALDLVASKVSMIGFGGGPLPQPTGDILTQHFRVFGMYGTSEIGVIHKIAPDGPWDNRCWNSIMPHPKENVTFRHRHDDCYEAVVVRNEDFEDVQSVFKLFPSLNEWGTKDLFSPDPDYRRKGSWIYQGRLDDVLILGNGSTVSPMGYEHQLVSSAPFVSHAIMYGTGRSQPGLLVQLSPAPPLQLLDVMEALSALVEQCNQKFPPQASISKSYIIVASADKPLPISTKGTVQRALALELYKHEIEALYG